MYIYIFDMKRMMVNRVFIIRGDEDNDRSILAPRINIELTYNNSIISRVTISYY